MTGETHGDAPAEVAWATQVTTDVAADAADQAQRLTMVMRAEAIHAALRGESGEGSLDGYDHPLEDTESVLAMKDADDANDDPMHAGGLDPAPWIPAEQAAMHIVDPSHPDRAAQQTRRAHRRRHLPILAPSGHSSVVPRGPQTRQLSTR